MKKFYWTFEKDGEAYDGEFESKKEALEHANEAFAEQCQEYSPKNGEEFEGEIYLLSFYYDDDGDLVIDECEKSSVHYEHYHGDLKEHGTWGIQ